MIEFLSMGGKGAYVWSAYGIMLAVFIGNIVSVRVRLRRSRAAAAAVAAVPTEPARRPKVSQL